MSKVDISKEGLKDAQEYIDFVKTNLEPLAEHLKVSVEWLWQILVNQARVEAIVYLVIWVMISFTTVTLTTLFFRHIKGAKFQRGFSDNIRVYVHKKTGRRIDSLLEDWDNREKYEPFDEGNKTNVSGYISYISGIGALVAMAVSLLYSTVALPIIVTGLVNPEYRAIEKIVEFAKPKAKQVVEESSDK